MPDHSTSKPCLALLASLVLLAGCESATDGEPSPALSARSAPLPESAAPELSCDIPAALPPGGITAVDTSRTPRDRQLAEILAMEASGELVAPEALYDRVSRDLRTLTGSSPGGTSYFGCGVHTELLVGMTEAGIQQVQNGQYTAWDGYNAALHLRSIEPKGYGAKLTFSGVYNFAAIEQAYEQLPEVRYAERNGLIGGSSDACLERFGDEADTHVYIFWSGSGDCPAGCIYSTYHGYATVPSGTAEYLGVHHGGDPEPDWFAKARQCRNFL